MIRPKAYYFPDTTVLMHIGTHGNWLAFIRPAQTQARQGKEKIEWD